MSLGTFSLAFECGGGVVLLLHTVPPERKRDTGGEGGNSPPLSQESCALESSLHCDPLVDLLKAGSSPCLYNALCGLASFVHACTVGLLVRRLSAKCLQVRWRCADVLRAYGHPKHWRWKGIWAGLAGGTALTQGKGVFSSGCKCICTPDQGLAGQLGGGACEGQAGALPVQFSVRRIVTAKPFNSDLHRAPAALSLVAAHQPLRSPSCTSTRGVALNSQWERMLGCVRAGCRRGDESDGVNQRSAHGDWREAGTLALKHPPHGRPPHGKERNYKALGCLCLRVKSLLGAGLQQIRQTSDSAAKLDSTLRRALHDYYSQQHSHHASLQGSGHGLRLHPDAATERCHGRHLPGAPLPAGHRL
ncbi:hypothetical protein JZ751_020459 [Albula glossodonta]|uniref:Uncharacterized protein n=1 Tax=Albula glossodonta TaxID=121402 RepID=A0A8T2PJS2_9TELE|nr:hypothetical protein JZ751_020459 [Albula glossodonta]